MKKLLSVILALIMVTGMLPAVISAASDLTVTDNIIDIADRVVYEKRGIGAVKVTNLKITDAEVICATEDNATIDVVLSGNTTADAIINIEFGATLDRNMNISGHKSEVHLVDGFSAVTMTLKGQYSSFGSLSGSITYTLNFSLDKIPSGPPERLVESEQISVYSGVSVNLNLKDYFKNAKEYYLTYNDEKTLIEGKTYTFRSFDGGIHTLIFSASNDNGLCPDVVTVSIEVTEIESGAWIGNESSNGSLNNVLFTDADENPIDGLTVTIDGKVISVVLPKDYPLGGVIKAKFDLTQNGDVPFITTKTGTSGTTSGKAINNKFTEKNLTLSAGAASFIFYYYNTTPTNTNNTYETWTLKITIANDLPVMSGDASAEATVEANKNYELDLAPLFADADGDALTYFVSINGAAAVAANANYVFTTDVAGTYTLVFTANDGKGTSTESYTVNLTVENSNQTHSMTVYLPEDLTPEFYASTGFAGGIDQLGVALETVKGTTVDGTTAYEVKYPINAKTLSVRTEDFGGMAFNAEKDGIISLRKVQFAVTDYNNNNAVSANTVTYSGNTAVSGSDGWLLVAGNEYVFTAAPQNADLTTASKTLTIDTGRDVYIASIMLGIKNPVSITVPKGAKAQLYKYNQYYSNTERDAKIITDNGDGTATYQFIADSKNETGLIYRVTMEGKITKAGWLGWNEQNLTVSYTENDKSPSYRLDDYSAAGEENSTVTEDSVLLNINSRNHLNLSVGQSKTLKAYRAWEIIPVSSNNYIIPPDFNFTILSGDDVVSLTEKASASACDGDRKTLTALKEGMAIIEVTYDAIDVRDSGNTVHYSGVYGASDPARSGLLVVQVGGNNDTSVKFGINGFSSIGTSGSNNITYNPSRQKEWDVEFDTLYFLKDSGTLTFNPTASSDITEASVSHDKGATWKTLSGQNGIYTAEIVSGNNILRVSTGSGTAYQVVRGDKISVKFDEVSDKSDDDGIIEAGETVRIYLNGLHNPVPKMAGNYNPGYVSNTDGFSAQHLNYTCNGTPIYGIGAQYNFITSANFVEIVMPEDGSSVTLTEGYIGLGVIGLPDFANGGDSHRNIPDSGCGTRGNQTTYHTRSILPETTVSVGDTSAPNNAPIVRKDAISEKEIYNDQNFAINPDTLFTDPDDDTMTFTVSVNGAEAADAPLDYKFTPNGTGTYTLLFTATDGKETAHHTITLTVTRRPSQGDSQDTPDSDEEFGLSKSEIAGYVTISFTDNGVRVKGESGLKYPKALGTIISATKVPYKAGEKIAHVTKRLLDHLGIRMEYTGTLDSSFYLGAICNFELNGTPYDSLGEFDAGQGSGWMITFNKKFIEYGASEFEVKNGDIIKWQYTCQLGADIGDPFYSGQTPSLPTLNNETEGENKEETEKPEEETKEDQPEEFTKNTFTETTFADVKKDDWHYESVKYVYEKGLMQGTDNGFNPESKMSRAMLVTVLYRMANPENIKNTHSFADVAEGQWYSDAVAWAAENGIAGGISKTEFAPNSNISREQMALIIYRFAKILGVDADEKADISSFKDADEISAWAVDAISWANKKELINGTTKTTLSPKATATRAQVAAILTRFLQKLEKQ